MSRKKKEILEEVKIEEAFESTVEDTEAKVEIQEVEDVQTTFNEDSIDILVEDGEVENECKEN